MARGWARAAGHTDGRWLLMEHAPGAGSSVSIADTYLSRGAVGVMYFQWRAGRSGAEQWHPAMVPLLDELGPLGSSLRSLAPVVVSATTALLYDEESMWAWQSPHLPTRLDYAALARRWHGALSGPVDVLPVSASLDGYSLVVVPALYLMSDETHAALRAFADAGGRLVIGFGSGLTDACLRTTPGALDDLIGARVGGPFFSDSPKIFLDGASAVLSSDDGEPIVTTFSYGAGEVRYVATDVDPKVLFGGPP
jgi:beta-galactosidase